jgi:hypothetical protein
LAEFICKKDGKKIVEEQAQIDKKKIKLEIDEMIQRQDEFQKKLKGGKKKNLLKDFMDEFIIKK